jgi:hypothetical protein
MTCATECVEALIVGKNEQKVRFFLLGMRRRDGPAQQNADCKADGTHQSPHKLAQQIGLAQRFANRAMDIMQKKNPEPPA